MSKQDEAVAKIIELAKLKSHTWYGIYGGPGVGKSHTISMLVEEATLQGLSCRLTATTGKASSIIHGQTIHSYLGMRMTINEDAEDEADAMKIGNPTKEVSGDILIIDEASMLDRHTINAISTLERDFKVIVLVGDINQLPPVKSKKPNLLNIEHMHLTKQHRIKHPAMQKLVDDIKLLISDDLSSINIMDYIDNKSVHLIDTIPIMNTTSCALAYHNKTVEAYIPIKHGDWYNLFNGVTMTKMGGEKLITEAVYPNGYDLKLDLVPIEYAWVTPTRKGGHYIYNSYLLPKLDIPNQYLAVSEEGVPFIAHKGTLEELQKLRQIEFNNAIDYKKKMEYKYGKFEKSYILKSKFDASERLEWNSLWSTYSNIASVIHIRPIEARTLHKSQGSTIENVYLDLDDIQKSKGSMLNALYVGLSRATDNLYIKGSDLVIWGANS